MSRRISYMFILLFIILAMSSCARTDFIHSDLLDAFNSELKEKYADVILLRLKATRFDEAAFSYILRVQNEMSKEQLDELLKEKLIPFIHSEESVQEQEKVIRDFGVAESSYRISVELYDDPESDIEFRTFNHAFTNNKHIWSNEDNNVIYEYSEVNR